MVRGSKLKASSGESDRPQFQEHMALRLNDLDFSRATEQTAIFMTLFAAHRKGKAYRPTAAELPLNSIMGYLSHTFCDGKLVHRDPRDATGNKEKFVRRLAAHSARSGARRSKEIPFGIATEELRGRPEWQLEVVTTPVDGLTALNNGMSSGAVSVIAAGPPGTFPPEGAKWLAKDYLVLLFCRTLSPKIGSILGSDFFATEPRLKKQGLDAACPVARENRRFVAEADTFLGFATRLIDKVQGIARQAEVPLLSWATSANEDYAQVLWRIKRSKGAVVEVGPLAQQEHSMTRAFEGSSFAAAGTALYDSFGVHAYIGSVRLTQLLQIAVAAHARDCQLIAIPIMQRGKSRLECDLDLGRPTLTERELVPGVAQGRDAFLCATGVNDNLLLRAVRVRSESVLMTNTMCLRAKAKASRIVTHHHDLRHKVFRFFEPPRGSGGSAKTTAAFDLESFLADVFPKLDRWRILYRNGESNEKPEDEYPDDPEAELGGDA